MVRAWKRQDRAAVLERLKEGDYDAITTSSQSALDELVHLSIELGVFDVLEVLQVKRERQGIPDVLLLRTLFVLPFVEAMGLSAAAGSLFKDAAILLQLGYTLVDLQEGFNGRRRGEGAEEKSEEAKPCHPEVLREELARIDVGSLRAFQREGVRRLFLRGLVRGGTYAIDGTGLGTRYQIVGLLNVHSERPFWVAWRVLKGEQSEKGQGGAIVKELIDQVIEMAGPGKIEWLLMDALYADGPLLAWLKYGRRIDVVVRLPQDRRAYDDLMRMVHNGLAKSHTHTDTCYISGHKRHRRITVTGIGAMRDWQSFCQAAGEYGEKTASLWACAIQTVDLAKPDETREWALVSTHAFPSAWKGYTLWRNRWRIENSGFRELKEGWHIEKAPWSYTHEAAVKGRVAFTLMAFNVAQIAKTSRGRQLTDRGIRRLRMELVSEYGPAPVVVIAGDVYGIFHIEEIAAAFGAPPAFRLQRPRSSPSGGHPGGTSLS